MRDPHDDFLSNILAVTLLALAFIVALYFTSSPALPERAEKHVRTTQ